MGNEYIRRLQANQLDAEEYCEQAKMLYAREKKHTKQEMVFYAKALECYEQNRKLSVGSDEEFYTKKVKECTAMILYIEDVLKKERELPKAAAAHKSAAGAEQPGAKTGNNTVNSGSQSGNSAPGKASGQDSGDKTADASWFREMPKHSFADVSGMETVKKKLINCASDSRFSGLKKYLKLKNLNSFFFYGPPATGKTFLIEAFVHEMMQQGYRYICLDAKDILSRYVGEAEKIIGRMFALAEEKAPCIVFIDEIDSVCKNRNLPKIAEYEASITTAFLTGYNRINSSDKEIVFLGATNFPERVDNAMLSRVEMVRFPLPDKAAREGLFKHLTKGLEEAGVHIGFPCEKMAELTEDYDCRDISRIMEGIGDYIYNDAKKKYPDEDSAIQAVKDGEYILDEALFRKIYDSILPSPKKEDKERLEKWERQLGIEPEKKPESGKAEGKGVSEKTAQSKADSSGKLSEKGGISVVELLRQAAEYEKNTDVQGGIFDSRNAGTEPDGRRRVHNPVPEKEIERAFFHAEKYYAPETGHWREAALRYREALLKELDDLNSRERTETVTWKILAVENALRNASDRSGNEKRVYRGIGNTGFPDSYDGYNTVRQGEAVHGFGGTCGIVASCNTVNQQTGMRMREEDGIREFVKMGICHIDPIFASNGYDFPKGLSDRRILEIYGSNGGTTSLDREHFVKSHGLTFERTINRTGSTNKGLFRKTAAPELTLEIMEERMRAGYSIQLALNIFDLVQPEIMERKKSNPRCFFTNHAVTVAGFTYGENGVITGMWINETGGATESTRVYITAQKFAMMRDNTRAMMAEFIRKRG